ncbi:hypothetical protein RHGRI_019558 [Rhododendron griersonianum]|uniref:RING-type E3 ubiquitin transferase n=1 Tax=Rhododendron griersonianum TaxID=479676 RepID=A0AAV6JKF1_9ERIC|nr:hypothetical protein RHGRI_019558 [Rhododendron griersonianum]
MSKRDALPCADIAVTECIPLPIRLEFCLEIWLTKVLCKFFANGACLKGDHCEFSHDWKDPSNNVKFLLWSLTLLYEHVKVSTRQSSVASSSTSSHQFLVSDSATASGGLTIVPGVTSDLSPSSIPFFPPVKPAWSQTSQHQYLSESDDLGDFKSLDPADLPICSFAAVGDCPRGEACPHIHGDICPFCGKNCLHPFRPQEREEHMKTCEKKQKKLEALKHSQEIECSVCLERVLSKPTASERKFGLLSECDHPFCISCIRNWRGSSPASGMDVNSTLRACPICRKVSYFVIPSVIWYSSKEEKQEIVDSYKEKLKSIHCKHFDFGNGSCPFGSSCFYMVSYDDKWCDGLSLSLRCNHLLNAMFKSPIDYYYVFLFLGVYFQALGFPPQFAHKVKNLFRASRPDRNENILIVLLLAIRKLSQLK